MSVISYCISPETFYTASNVYNIIPCTIKKFLLPLSIGGIFILLMVLAGFWQLDRAKQKLEIKAGYARALEQPVYSIAESDVLPEAALYQRIRLKGHFINEHQFLLDNQVYSEGLNKQIGYDVITPFVIGNGQTVLVNRGWVAAGSNRDQLPNVNIRVDGQKQEITGLVSIPMPGYRLGEMDADLRWPRVIQYIDFDKISARLQQKIHPSLIILDAGQANVYHYHWKLIADNPEKHYSYALQWFGMALALVILLFILFKRNNI